MKNKIFLVASLCLLVSCGQQKREAAMAADSISIEDAIAAKSVESARIKDFYSDGRKIVKNASYRFEVKSVKETTSNIERYVQKYGAYVASSNLNLENPILENKMCIRVQNEYFQDLLRDIDQQAVFVNFRNVTTQDVTRDFVDLESRLRTKREVEQRYMEILRKKASTVKELLEAEEQIGSLQEEIEATVGRMNYLKDQVSYSTINLEYYQKITETISKADEVTFLDKMGNAIMTGVAGVGKIVIGLVYIWPLLLIAGTATLVLSFIRRKRKNSISL